MQFIKRQITEFGLVVYAHVLLVGNCSQPEPAIFPLVIGLEVGKWHRNGGQRPHMVMPS